MGKFIANGRRRLVGRVDVSGSKNAALPIIFATIAMRGVSVIDNLPDITDVKIALDISFVSTSLALIISLRSSTVASLISSFVFCATVIAPLIPLEYII